MRSSRPSSTSWANIVKRAFDILVAGVLLVALWPLLLAVALVIRLSSRGPALFVQQRAGRDGKPFGLCKFRTMRLDVDPFGPSPKSGEDPRLTRVGRWLREYSLDELPQLANIVKGDMSLVGPRPLYVSQMAEWNERQRRRLSIRPGLTGLAQISGRGALTREEKLELDVRYVERAGLRLDAAILLATLAHVCGRKGIYEQKYSQDETVRGERTLEQTERPTHVDKRP
ncbi:sugar transferase [Anaerobaca lacustris]|uniref:Sugar transferase n=1 Tax=Anaerobaca lacustris TaxID=3044600 RepID=A0AAW6TT92_9BACT|nr:sugar transferase [Sedimentisphaerales bacterium M17dextr]